MDGDDDSNSSDQVQTLKDNKSDKKQLNKILDTLYRDVGPTTLILAVQKRPAIWNKWHKDYIYKDKKQKLWLEIMDELFAGSTEEMELWEKEHTVNFLSTKWRNLRDCYTKSKKNPDKTPYIYSNHLKFLDSQYSQNPSLEQDESSASIQSDIEVIIDGEDDNNSSDLLQTLEDNTSNYRIISKRFNVLYKKIGPETLIKAVKKRPVLWKRLNENLTQRMREENRVKREKLWMEIADELFGSSVENVGSKKNVVNFLTKKWRKLQFVYLRDVKGCREDPTYEPSSPYARHLKFLDRMYSEEDPSLELEISSASSNDTGMIEEEITNHSPSKPMRNLGSTSYSNANDKNSPRVFKPDEPNADDVNFFRSLLPFVRPLPMNLKMQFRIDILEKALRYYENPQKEMPRPPTMPQYTKSQAPMMKPYHSYQYPPPAQQFYNPTPSDHHFQQPFFNLPHQGQHMHGNRPTLQPMQMPNNFQSIPQGQNLSKRAKLTNFSMCR